MEEQGATVKVLSAKLGKVQGFKHDAKADVFDVDLTFEDADELDFDALVLPVGVTNADQIRMIPATRNLVR